MREIIEKCSKKFSNGVEVVNTIPHVINFLDGDEIVAVEADPSLVVNASVAEMEVGKYLVQSVFSGNSDGERIINAIKELKPDAIIIGSILAANSYKEVCGMCPAPGFERVPPAEKRMSIEKFNVGELY